MKNAAQSATTAICCTTCQRVGSTDTTYPMIDHDFAGFSGPHMDYEAVSEQEVGE